PSRPTRLFSGPELSEKRARQRAKDRRLPGRKRGPEQRSIVKFIGAVAQLGERLLCKQEVVGSIPSSSTINDLPIGCTLRSVQLWASAWSPKLKAVLFFNN